MFSIYYTGEEGIEAIKKILLSTIDQINKESEEIKIEMRLEAPPFYKVITSMTTSKSKGIEIVNKTLDLIGKFAN